MKKFCENCGLGELEPMDPRKPMSKITVVCKRNPRKFKACDVKSCCRQWLPKGEPK